MNRTLLDVTEFFEKDELILSHCQHSRPLLVSFETPQILLLRLVILCERLSSHSA